MTIEREYLYWTNDNNVEEYGALNKAFTEPFVRAVPFFTFGITDAKAAYSITAN